MTKRSQWGVLADASSNDDPSDLHYIPDEVFIEDNCSRFNQENEVLIYYRFSKFRILNYLSDRGVNLACLSNHPSVKVFKPWETHFTHPLTNKLYNSVYNRPATAFFIEEYLPPIDTWNGKRQGIDRLFTGPQDSPHYIRDSDFADRGSWQQLREQALIFRSDAQKVHMAKELLANTDSLQGRAYYILYTAAHYDMLSEIMSIQKASFAFGYYKEQAYRYYCSAIKLLKDDRFSSNVLEAIQARIPEEFIELYSADEIPHDPERHTCSTKESAPQPETPEEKDWDHYWRNQLATEKANIVTPLLELAQETLGREHEAILEQSYKAELNRPSQYWSNLGITLFQSIRHTFTFSSTPTEHTDPVDEATKEPLL